MNQDNAVVSVFSSHDAADEAVKELSQNGFDMTRLSIVGKGYHSEEHAVGFYTAGDRIKSWGATGAFWGGIWGLLLTPALFLVPGLGVVGLAGPIVTAVVSALEGAVLGGGVTAIGAALAELGVPKNDAVKYETAVKANGFLLIVHGTTEEVEQARAILSKLGLFTVAGSETSS
ncbi:hypothetical protein SAMN02787142_7201 [Burkholderia sp. WP9]|uniref:general stress protein n=1 Tax=Burkholderia sp. WP9 TaxID=1500263 RepID=UPI00089B46BA|nr:general stress protein [Burkholderia sp. WP9]SEF05918.1 hypothetical protein SAMN02787142_7201 [Burkholderia sp. WP9]